MTKFIKNKSESKPKLPWLGKRVKKIIVYVNGNSHTFFIQANKNHGICNIVKIDYNSNTYIKANEALNKYYGRQYDSSNTIYQLQNFLEEWLSERNF